MRIRPESKAAAVPALAVVLALIVAACGGDGAASPAAVSPAAPSTSAPSESAVSPATPSPAPTPRSTPSSPPSVDVARAFLAMWSRGLSAEAELDGSVSIGPLTMPISGTSLLSGPDSHQTMTLTTGVKPTTTETIKAGGHTYAKRGDLWYEQPATSNGDLGAVLMTLSSLTDTGPVTKDGRSLHRLAPPAGTTIPLSAFGGLPAGATDATVAFEFYAEDDGTPAIISVDASWTQKVGKADQPASMHLEMIMARVGQPVNIEPPSPVWVTVRSKRLAYTMAHPSDWDVELAKKGSSNDWFYGPEGERLGVVRVVDCRCTLNTFTAELIRYERKHTKGFKLASNTAARVGGLRARRLESRGTYTDGRSWDLTYVVLRGRYLYVLDYGSDSPLTAQDRTIAAQLLGTVAFR